MFSSDSLHNIIVVIYRYINPVIYILGNIGNLLSAIILSQQSWKNNVCVFYFKVYLFLSSIYLNSTILGFTFVIGFNINVQHSNAILCKVFYYLPCFISTLLPTILIFASIDRLLISSQNMNARLYNSKSLAYIFISLSTLFWLPFNSHILAKISLQKIDSSVDQCSYDFKELRYDYVYYTLLINDVLFLLIIFILCMFSLKTVHRIRIAPRRQQPNQIRSITMKDFQLLRCLFVYNIIYIVSSIFSAVYSVYNEVTNNKIRTSSEQAISDFFNDLFTLFGFIFYSTSFLIFLIVSKAFRRKFKQLFYRIFGKCFKTNRKKKYNQRDLRRNNVKRKTLVIMTTMV